MLTGIKNLDIEILNQLEDKDLVKICQTNQEINNICNDQQFWWKRILFKFPYISLKVLNENIGDRTWSDYYIYDLRKINPSNATQYLQHGTINNRLDHIAIAIRITTNIDYAVIVASQYGYLGLVKFFVEQGADIHTINDRALKMASYNDHLGVVKYLVERGANITLNNQAVVSASRKGHLAVVKYLIEKGADFQADNNFPVKIASRNGHLAVVKCLIEKGADFRDQNDAAVKWANNGGHAEVVEYLVNMGASAPNPSEYVIL